MRAAILLVGLLLLLPGLPVRAGPLDLAGVRIALDPGHGGSDPGAQGFGLQEKAVNLDVVLRLRALLEAEGASVLLTRDCDCTVSLGARTDAANAWGAHRFVSVHANACGSCGAQGTETYYHTSLPSTSTAARLAALAREELVQHLQTTDRGVKQANFHVLRESAMPAILVELGFVDHAGDNAKLASAAWRQEAARGLLHAVQRHYGFPPHDPDTGAPFEVRILNPAPGAWLRGTVEAQGISNREGSLAWMRFLVDGAVTKWVTPAPHTWTWDTTAWPDGARTLRLEAQDTQGARAADEAVVHVDNTPPAVALDAPRSGAAHVGGASVPLPAGLTVALGVVPVRATATDASPGAVARVDFRVDGTLRASDTSAPYEWAWPAHRESPGSHVVRAEAVDRAGNVAGASVVVHLTVPSP